MSIWVWLSRVTVLGLTGTVALATLFFATLGMRNSDGAKRSNEVHRIQAATISPEEVKALQLSAPAQPTLLSESSPPTPISQPSGSEATESDTKSNRSKSTGSDTKSNQSKSTESDTKPNRSKPTGSDAKSNRSKPTGSDTKSNRSSKKMESVTKVQRRPFNLQQSLKFFSPLFATPTSLGMVAIGVAEGNYQLVVKNGTLYVQQTPLYFGHTDPGNLSWGQTVTNYGPCSDQGRSGGNIAMAEQQCLERSRYALPTQLVDLSTAGINPDQDLEALLNAADLYNQASPIHSRYFPQALAIARRGGLTGIDAIAWARTASFYLNANNQLDLQQGRNQATGLIGICARENRPVTEWQCVHGDQMRRVKAIYSVLEKYRRFMQAKGTSGIDDN
ncbi:MAG TPA: hypothetical protein V6D11_13330 [Waterburya sp.]|jgi:hypothetical protein